MAGEQMPEPMTKEAVKEALKDVKIGSKLQAKWTETMEKAKEAIMVDTMNIEVSEAIIEIAEKRIAIEKEKFK